MGKNTKTIFKGILISLVFISIIFVAFVIYIFMNLCENDVRICHDGSETKRSGIDCHFTPCPKNN